jgi:hypothetical protein
VEAFPRRPAASYLRSGPVSADLQLEFFNVHEPSSSSTRFLSHRTGLPLLGDQHGILIRLNGVQSFYDIPLYHLTAQKTSKVACDLDKSRKQARGLATAGLGEIDQ